jgi:peroxiredoxin
MPDAFAVGGLLLPTWRLTVLGSLLLAIWLAARAARRQGLDGSWISSVTEHSVWLGILGARSGFVLANWSAYQDAPWTALYVWQPGYLAATGLLAGAAYVLWRVWQRNRTERGPYLRALTGGFAVAALLVGGVYASMRLPMGSGVLRVGDTVPDFTLQTLDGEKVSFSSLEGQAVVLNFWATWCPPCRREMPLLDDIQRVYGSRGVTIIGVSFDEPAPVVQRYIDTVDVTYPIWVDAPGNRPDSDRTRELYARFGGIGLPTTVFIDKNGIIRARQLGELNRAVLQSQIEALLFARPSRD